MRIDVTALAHRKAYSALKGRKPMYRLPQVVLMSLATFAIYEPAMAQAKPVWPLEPTSFIGLRFDAPFRSQIPQCTEGMAKLCYRKPTMMYQAPLDNLPDLGFPITHSLAIDGAGVGRLLSIVLSMSSLDSHHMKNVLEARYGPPTKETERPSKDESGIPTTNTTYHWKGQHLNIWLETNTMFTGDGSLVVSSEDSKNAVVKAYNEDAKKAGEKL